MEKCEVNWKEWQQRSSRQSNNMLKISHLYKNRPHIACEEGVKISRGKQTYHLIFLMGSNINVWLFWLNFHKTERRLAGKRNVMSFPRRRPMRQSLTFSCRACGSIVSCTKLVCFVKECQCAYKERHRCWLSNENLESQNGHAVMSSCLKM